MNVLVIGAVVLDIAASPVGAAASWREKQWINDVKIGIGGDAANQCVHLASLGHHARLAACLGDDENGRTLLGALKARGVDTGAVVLDPDKKTGTSVILISEDGERHIFSVPGAHRQLSEKQLPESLLDGCDAVSVASLLNLPVLEESGMRRFLGKARERGMPVFGDLCACSEDMDREQTLGLLDLFDHFLPSSYDVMNLTGTRTEEEAARALRGRGVGTAVIKCGERGAYVLAEDFAGRIPARAVRAVDTTGCGDCMSAAYLSAVLEGAAAREAAAFGCAAGTVCAGYPGASDFVLRREEIRNYIEDGS